MSFNQSPALRRTTTSCASSLPPGTTCSQAPQTSQKKVSHELESVTKKTQPKKSHVTFVMTPQEAALLTQTRARIELSQGRRCSTSQVLREAIQQAYDRRETAPL